MSDFIYEHPKHKLIKNDGAMKILAETGHIALMCPECFHMVKTYSSYTKIINNILDKVEDFRTENVYYGACPNCKEDVKFEIIDVNMSQIINILNTKGYYTAFCCEGHIEPNDYTGEEEVTLPYVYFYLWEDANVLETNPLPDSWYIGDEEKECEEFVIRDNICKSMPKSIINGNEIHDLVAYNGWLKRHWDKEKRIKDLYDWAIGLPDKDEFLKEVLHGYVKAYGKNILLQNAEKIIEYQNKDEE